MKNEQRPLPIIWPEDAPEGRLHVHSIFPTIQGEGPHAGRPAVFLRLYGCNLKCPGCDTDYTSSDIELSPEEIFRLVAVKRVPTYTESTHDNLLVITGGEPFRQPIVPLISFFLRKMWTVQVESNGTVEVDYLDRFRPALLGGLLDIVVSPKTSSISPSLRNYATAYKYILEAGEVCPQDGLPLRSLSMSGRPARPPEMMSRARVYVQPFDSKDPEENLRNQQAAVRSCLTFGHRMSVQTHKLLDLP